MSRWVAVMKSGFALIFYDLTGSIRIIPGHLNVEHLTAILTGNAQQRHIFNVNIRALMRVKFAITRYPIFIPPPRLS